MDYAILTERLGKIGARRYDNYATLVETWIDPGEAIPTEAQYASEDIVYQSELTQRATAETAFLAADTANLLKADSMLAAFDTMRIELDALETAADTLARRSYTGANLAAHRSEVQLDMRALGTRLADLVGIVRHLVNGAEFVVRRERRS